MDNYRFSFEHPLSLKKNFQKRKMITSIYEYHYSMMLIKSLIMALDTKLNWFSKKMFLPSFASRISFNSCVNTVK